MLTAVMPKGSSKFVVGKTLSTVRWLEPAMTTPTFCSTKLMPIAAMSAASLGACRNGL